MAQKKTFFEQPIDRTPYAACVWVALAVLALFVVGVLGLWRVSGMVKRSLPKPHLAPVSTNVLNQAKDAAKTAADEQAAAAQQKLQDSLKQQEDAAAQSAADAAKQAAEKQAQSAVDQQKNQLQQFLPQ